jgi:hypothetical protein
MTAVRALMCSAADFEDLTKNPEKGSIPRGVRFSRKCAPKEKPQNQYLDWQIVHQTTMTNKAGDKVSGNQRNKRRLTDSPSSALECG